MKILIKKKIKIIYIFLKNKMFVMFNIFNLVCICIYFVFYLSSFFLVKLFEVYVFLNLIVDIMLVIFLFFFF